MIKKIDIVGIHLENGTVRETILELERELADQGFHTVEEVNTDLLMLAASDETVRSALMALNHTVIAETGILDAAGVTNYQRRHEVENHDFFHAIMQRIERGHKGIYLIGDSQALMDAFALRIAGLYPDCTLVGSAMLEGWEGAIDAVVNDINAATPDVVLSILPSPQQEYFLAENRDKLLAGLWYGIGALELDEREGGIVGFFRKKLRMHRLKKSIRNYSEGQVRR